jgi:hypothetical protein
MTARVALGLGLYLGLALVARGFLPHTPASAPSRPSLPWGDSAWAPVGPRRHNHALAGARGNARGKDSNRQSNRPKSKSPGNTSPRTRDLGFGSPADDNMAGGGAEEEILTLDMPVEELVGFADELQEVLQVRDRYIDINIDR